MFTLYWERNTANFGDELSPLICEKLSGEKVEFSWNFKKCDMVAIGSILQHIPEDQFRGGIWGAGLISPFNLSFPKARIFAVRGKLTRHILGCSREVAVGDPGLLCDMFARKFPTKYKLGIIPHYVDADHPIVNSIAASSNDITVIDICGGVQRVIDKVTQCEAIISSCLHGLILADSLGLPNDWIKLSDKVTGGNFKFQDYYSIYGIDNKKPMRLKTSDSIDTIMAWLKDYERPGINDIKTQLIESFPFKKGNISYWGAKRKLGHSFAKFENLVGYYLKKMHLKKSNNS